VRSNEQKAIGMRIVGDPAAPDIEPLLTAAEVGRVLAIATKRVYKERPGPPSIAIYARCQASVAGAKRTASSPSRC
jgi:hypothetical protein